MPAKRKFRVGETMYRDPLSDLVVAYEACRAPLEPAADADMLRPLMAANGVTEAELHRDMGLAKSSIAAVLAGRTPLGRQMLRKPADDLQVEVRILASNL